MSAMKCAEASVVIRAPEECSAVGMRVCFFMMPDKIQREKNFAIRKFFFFGVCSSPFPRNFRQMLRKESEKKSLFDVSGFKIHILRL